MHIIVKRENKKEPTTVQTMHANFINKEHPHIKKNIRCTTIIIILYLFLLA